MTSKPAVTPLSPHHQIKVPLPSEHHSLTMPQNCLKRRSLSVSYGKVILCGEHGVVYGAKALGMPINDLKMNTTVSLSSSSHHQIKINSSDLSEELTPSLNHAWQLLLAYMKSPQHDSYQDHPSKHQPTFKLEINSEIPLGAGLGASAALCVSMIGSLSAIAGLTIANTTLISLANELEKRFHGTPSGLDVSILTYNSLISFTKNKSPVAIQKPGFFHLALIDCGVRSPTKMMCHLVAQKMTDATNKGDIIRRFNQCHDLMHQAIMTKNIKLMKTAIEKSCLILRELSVVSHILEQTMTTVRQLGATACKPTGSGGAGFILALLPLDVKKRNQLSHALRQKFPLVVDVLL
ncbi:MAG: mevalonate kinase [Proteobacteria bacterium]|nr:mevalonate kinase [Pseudomonadota bacterium]